MTDLKCRLLGEMAAEQNDAQRPLQKSGEAGSEEGVKRGHLMAARRNLCKSSDSSRTASAIVTVAAAAVGNKPARNQRIHRHASWNDLTLGCITLLGGLGAISPFSGRSRSSIGANLRGKAASCGFVIVSEHSIDDIQLIGGADVMAGERGANQTEHKNRVIVCVRERTFTQKLSSYANCFCTCSALTLNQLKKLSVYMV